jgi:hypothetical protein
MNQIKPFYQWKDEQIEKDSKKYNVVRYYRCQEWYWEEYGKYCNKQRKRNEI